MNKKEYSSSLKKTPYKYLIAKKIAKLMLNNMDRAEVYKECYNNNYIEIDSLERRREIINIIYERLLSHIFMDTISIVFKRLNVFKKAKSTLKLFFGRELRLENKLILNRQMYF